MVVAGTFYGRLVPANLDLVLYGSTITALQEKSLQTGGGIGGVLSNGGY